MIVSCRHCAHSAEGRPRATSREVLQTHSFDAGVVMLGFVVPEASDTNAFDRAYRNMVAGLPTTMLISSTGDADLLA